MRLSAVTCTKIVWRTGSARTRWGVCSIPNPLAGFGEEKA